jgi:hypothetical protein
MGGRGGQTCHADAYECPWIARRCERRLKSSEKDLPQPSIGHLNGRSPGVARARERSAAGDARGPGRGARGWALRGTCVDKHVALEARRLEEGLAAVGPRAREELAPLRDGGLALERLLRLRRRKLVLLGRQLALLVRHPPLHCQDFASYESHLHRPPLPLARLPLVHHAPAGRRGRHTLTGASRSGGAFRWLSSSVIKPRGTLTVPVLRPPPPPHLPPQPATHPPLRHCPHRARQA